MLVLRLPALVVLWLAHGVKVLGSHTDIDCHSDIVYLLSKKLEHYITMKLETPVLLFVNSLSKLSDNFLFWRLFVHILRRAISRSSQCSTTGVTKVVVCVILSVGWYI